MNLDNDSLNPSQFNGLVRVGIVSSVSGSTARVMFNDVGGMMSGDLKIVQWAPVAGWAPLPGMPVLCLYDGTFNGNGYVLGTL
ncbi:MAG: hypothetical protein IK093_16645 [Ruminiclostridium sp.]|nr:hypothetical protein [Ruminiclostridium sp.]